MPFAPAGNQATVMLGIGEELRDAELLEHTPQGLKRRVLSTVADALNVEPSRVLVGEVSARSEEGASLSLRLAVRLLPSLCPSADSHSQDTPSPAQLASALVAMVDAGKLASFDSARIQQASPGSAETCSSASWGLDSDDRYLSQYYMALHLRILVASRNRLRRLWAAFTQLSRLTMAAWMRHRVCCCLQALRKRDVDLLVFTIWRREASRLRHFE